MAKGFGEAQGDVPDHLGHRERLRERFRKGGADALPDYELLELVLFRTNARGNTKPIAKGQLITTANTAVPAGSKIAELRARQDRLVYGQ